VNFAVAFLRGDGAQEAATPLAEIVRHVEYVASRIGIDHVAFGSDFDGALVPEELGGIAGFPRLVDELRAAGFDDPALTKITHGNWLRVLGETWR
jgi:membrane dipeptidase